MKTIRWECDNYCGDHLVGGDGPVEKPLGWTSLVEDSHTWHFCSHACLVDFLYKSERNLALGASVSASIVGSLCDVAESPGNGI